MSSRGIQSSRFIILALAALAIICSGTRILSQSQTSASTSPSIIKSGVTIEHTDRVDLVAFHPDGMMLASESFLDGLKLSDAETGALLRTMDERGFSANSISFSHDSNTLATGNNDGKVRLWDAQMLSLKGTLTVSKWSVYALAFSQDDATLACNASDGTVKLWDVNTGKLAGAFGRRGQRVESIAFSPDGTLLATVNIEGQVNLWEIATGKLVGTLPEATRQNTISFCDDGKTAAIAGTHGIRFWDFQREKKAQMVKVPDSIDSSKKIEELDDPERTGRMLPMSRFVHTDPTILSPDCKTAATLGEDGTIAVWPVQTRMVQRLLGVNRPPKRVGGMLLDENGVMIITFSPDGKLLASGSDSGKVDVWRIE